jgi:glucosamine 6-phosphate synthetase-like amidotransferase/phosphosugar isomerase protein
MCGLVGALACGEFQEKRLERIRQESMIFLTTELLTLTQTRGKDATGVATMFSDCDYMGLKMGISAQEFIARFGSTEEDYEGYLKIWRKKVHPAKISIGHCRKPSLGGASGPEDNKNNHPIKIGDIVGVHNGTLTNHEKIFTNLGCKRDGNVDSEAIFRLLHHYTNNGTEPFTVQALQETCKRISGTYAVMAFSGNNPFQMAAFRDNRPLEVAIIRPIKLVLIASEKDFLRMAIFRYNKMAHLYQTGAMRFTSLKKDDVEFETLTDDSLYLFDVRKEITAATKVKDLCITEKIPRIDKIWVSSKTTATNSTNPNWVIGNGSHYQNGVKKTEVMATNIPSTTSSKTNGPQSTTPMIPITTSTESVKQDLRSGMVWNRASAQYESISGIEETKKHGNVEINCENGAITNIKTDKIIMQDNEKNSTTVNSTNIPVIENPEFTFEESDKPVDDLISDPAKISEVGVSDSSINCKKTEDPVIASYKCNKTTDPTDEFLEHLEMEKWDSATKAVSTKAEKVEIDLSTHPDVLETSVKVTREQPNFSTDMDLANALEITNIDAMKNMELYSLANRIKVFFFKRGWYSGYVARLNEEGSFDENKSARALLLRTQNKQKAAQDTIRNMKSITHVFWNMLKNGPEESIHENAVNKAVNETLDKRDLKSGILEKAFKPGDFKEIPVLSKIMASITNKENE